VVVPAPASVEGRSVRARPAWAPAVRAVPGPLVSVARVVRAARSAPGPVVVPVVLVVVARVAGQAVAGPAPSAAPRADPHGVAADETWKSCSRSR
jgi:hypothetical protein